MNWEHIEPTLNPEGIWSRTIPIWPGEELEHTFDFSDVCHLEEGEADIPQIEGQDTEGSTPCRWRK